MTRRRRRSARMGAALLLGAILAGTTGCPPAPVPLERASLQTVIDRVNRNSGKMDFLLKATGEATGEFTGRTGNREKFQVSSVVLYRKPMGLYMKLEHTWTGRIEVGSNDKEFWFWDKTDPNHKRYLWGEHRFMDWSVDDDIPVRPDHLLEVLGLGELSMEGGDWHGPFFRALPEHYEFVYLDEDITGRRFISKAMRINGRSEHFLPGEILFYDPGGYPVMIAKLTDHKIVRGSAVRAPHKIRIEWPGNKNWLELDFKTMQRFDKPAAEELFRSSPKQQGKSDLGYVRRVDHPRVPVLPPASQPAPLPATSGPS